MVSRICLAGNGASYNNLLQQVQASSSPFNPRDAPLVCGGFQGYQKTL